MRTTVRRLPALTALIVLCAACRTEVTVDVAIENDGSGTVTVEVVMDAEVAAGLEDIGGDASLPLEDLAQAGWQVTPPSVGPEGATTVVASKDFGDTQQFAEVMAELTGDDGVFRAFELERVQTFGRIDYRLDGVIDPTGGFDSFGDDDLEARLGRSLGNIAISPPYEATPEDVIITLTAQLPGELQEEGSNGEMADGEAGSSGRWQVDLAGSQPIDVAFQSARRSTAAQVLRGVAIMAAVLAGLVAFGQLLREFSARRRRLQEERRRASRRQARTDARGGDGEGAAGQVGGLEGLAPNGQVDEPTATDQTAYRLVALDGAGVLYREPDDIRKLLVPSPASAERRSRPTRSPTKPD